MARKSSIAVRINPRQLRAFEKRMAGFVDDAARPLQAALARSRFRWRRLCSGANGWAEARRTSSATKSTSPALDPRLRSCLTSRARPSTTISPSAAGK